MSRIRRPGFQLGDTTGAAAVEFALIVPLFLRIGVNAVLAFLLFPFGLEHLALVPMGWGVDGVIRVGKMVAGWDGAVALFPAGSAEVTEK